MAEKVTLMVVVKKEDSDYFKNIQKEYKEEGKSAMILFSEFVECHKEKNKLK